MVKFSYWKVTCKDPQSEADAFYFVCLKICLPLRFSAWISMWRIQQEFGKSQVSRYQS